MSGESKNVVECFVFANGAMCMYVKYRYMINVTTDWRVKRLSLCAGYQFVT